MNDQQTIKTVLALLVMGKVLSQSQANKLYDTVELNLIRGVALPGSLNEILTVLERKS